MAGVDNLFGNPAGDAKVTSLSTFDVGSIASSPSTTKDGGTIASREREIFEKAVVDNFKPKKTIDNVIAGVEDSTDQLVDDVSDKLKIDNMKTLANDLFGDKEMLNDLKDTFWDDLKEGEFDPDKLLEHKGIAGLVNAMKGTNCMETDLDDFYKGILDNILDQGWGLGDAKFFECLLTDLKNMGTGFLNSVVKNSTTILKDESMAALKGVGDVLGQEAQEVLPDFTDALSSFAGDLGGDEIDSIMSTIDADWLNADNGDMDLGIFTNASEMAKDALGSAARDEIKMGLTLDGMFETTTSQSDFLPRTLYTGTSFSDLSV